jgi:hypothetical protein
MKSKCFGFNWSRKSKSNTNINSLNKTTSNQQIISKKKSFSCIHEQASKNVFIKTSELILEEPENNNDSGFLFDYQIKKSFLDQSISNIRLSNKIFEDSKFLPFISSIVESTDSQLYVSLVSRFKGKNLIDLNNLIKWKRIKVFKYLNLIL